MAPDYAELVSAEIEKVDTQLRQREQLPDVTLGLPDDINDVSDEPEVIDPRDNGGVFDLAAFWRRVVRHFRRPTPEMKQKIVGSIALAVLVYVIGKRIRRALCSSKE